MVQTRETTNAGGERSLDALEFACSEVSVGPLVQAGEELGPKAGAFRRRDVTIRDGRQLGDEFLVPAGVIGADRLLDKGVRQIHGEVGRGGKHYRPGTVMGCHRQVLGLGHRCDLLGLAESAAPAEVEHNDSGGPLIHEATEGGSTRERLAGRYRYVSGRCELGEGVEIVRPYRVLEPVRLELLEGERDSPRGREIPEGVKLDHHVYLHAHRLAYLAERFEGLL